MASNCFDLHDSNDDIKVQQNPYFDVLGSQTNKQGYNYTVCVECEIKSSNDNSYKFKSYPFKVVLSPDCSDALISKPILTDYDINYNKQRKTKNIGVGYESFFQHENKDIC